MISVICPTIDGREESLERCERSYSETSDDFEFIVVRNMPTCNQAWNVGIPDAKGEFIHLSADDIEAQAGWWQVGVKWIEMGFIPAPRILNADGTLQSCGDGNWEEDTGTISELTRVPFFSREQMDRAGIFPIKPPGQYCGDYYVTHRGRMVGIETVVVREMVFVHHFSAVGRLDHMLYSDYDDFRHIAQQDIRAQA